MTAADTIPGDLPDPHTTAGKIADLERRRYEAVHAGSLAGGREAARQGQADRPRADRPAARRGLVHRVRRAGQAPRARLRHRARTARTATAWSPAYGTVDGRPVAVYSQDFTVFGGSLGEVYGEKIVKVMDHAMKTGCPVIGINDGGGARIQEGVVALGLFAEIFFRNTRASGVIPQICLIMGPAAGGAVYSPAITDFTLMVEGTSHMFITGPDVIKTVTGEDVTMEELGGAHAHAAKSGVAHYQADRRGGLHRLRPGAAVLPAVEQPRRAAGHPDRPRLHGHAAEIRRGRARHAHPRLAEPALRHAPGHRDRPRRGDVPARSTRRSRRTSSSASAGSPGAPVGVVANQPMHFAGCLDIDASEKAARFVRTCDAFSIPILTFVDVPGFLPGVTQEWARHHPPRRQAALRLRRGHRPQGHRHHPQGLRRRLRRHGLQAPRRRRQPRLADRADRGDGRPGRGQHPLPQGTGGGREPRSSSGRSSTAEYEDTLANPYIAAERGYLDAVIRPAETRAAVTRALQSACAPSGRRCRPRSTATSRCEHRDDGNARRLSTSVSNRIGQFRRQSQAKWHAHGPNCPRVIRR